MREMGLIFIGIGIGILVCRAIDIIVIRIRINEIKKGMNHFTMQQEKRAK